jgi:uncharacterized phage-associated protein
MSLKTYDSVIAAKYLIALANAKDIVLNVTKVQKMLYIAYGYFLAEYDHLILNEQPKAWPYGPVFPRTRSKVDYGVLIKINEEELSEIRADQTVTEVFNNIIEKYSKYSASQLSEWSHMKDGPWAQSTKQNGFDWNQPIPDSFIKSYFKELNV